MDGFIEAAPAKLNLYLHVTGRRADGYHELDSLVAFASAGDRVTVTPDPDGPRLHLSGPFAPALAGEPPSGNLVLRAVTALAERFGRAPAVSVALDKHLPVASGIGGGSADAAACLRGLARLWEIAPDHPALFEVAASLGADVPVCLDGRTRYFGGIGDELAPAPALPEIHLVLANPGVPVPTPAVFKARRQDAEGDRFSPPARFAGTPADAADLAGLLRERRNDLTGAALSVAPAIAGTLAALDDTPGCLLSRLSGSGATCFALYAHAEEAEAAAGRITAAHNRWWVKAARMLG
ncbi:4-(cytidine 5'-diphospho)-2-C-methyl-D-erythritol kinase [Azospirillum sp. SYSU D00513]|uniref:4-(cytidine 5'-diphospho)-2-C-methyl-D-erythritol kinase n=1 Tax=Azospirillum sp. SYSU D00513 TaxID=2812561 RepID=UPI001A95F45F|nr:4-(cytidine 5'-diphospho)-2-C-methyl-D-erythritol kinase [Azospirillum sp. SYSU D00513]